VNTPRIRVAVLDDWQEVAASSADWAALLGRAEVVFFHTPFTGEDDAAHQLRDFDVVMAMRERTPFPASLVGRLPKLRLFSLTGVRAAAVDMSALRARGVTITGTEGGGTGTATAELALALMLTAVRHLPLADAAMRRGGFQRGVPLGEEMAGKTLGVIGLGKLGGMMARYGVALGMNVLAWSQNLKAETAAAAGATLVDKATLLERSDVISLHLVLSARSRGILAAEDLARMRQGALLVNTSRGPLVDEPALLAALTAGRIRVALDVYDREPLPPDHPLRGLPNTVLSPHLGYGTAATFQDFYRQSVENVLAFLDGSPIRVLHAA
jgi:phosphoglycerate dehydrogenase-like enzyme